MTPTETAAILRQFNEWRRGDYEPSEQPSPPDPCEIGEAIDAAVEMIDRLNGMGSEREAALMAKLEAAEKERGIDEQRIADLMEELNQVGHELSKLRKAWRTQRENIKSIARDKCKITEERDALRAEVESWKGLARQFGNEADAMRTHLSFAKDELNRSRAKIAEMEKQEPAG